MRFSAFPNFIKVVKFATSIERPKAKSVSASGAKTPRPGALPLNPAGGEAPRPPYRLALSLAMPPFAKS